MLKDNSYKTLVFVHKRNTILTTKYSHQPANEISYQNTKQTKVHVRDGVELREWETEKKQIIQTNSYVEQMHPSLAGGQGSVFMRISGPHL